jgi:tetratricopeptide (TPR) repeat protein
LSRRDARFAGVVDDRTVRLFVIWFFACIAMTVTNIYPIANVAHGAGALIGVLVGFAIADAGKRRIFVAATASVVLFGTWAATVGRPKVNLSSEGGMLECRAGYEAHQAQQPEAAAYWFREATTYRSLPDLCWYALGLTEDSSGRPAEAVAAYRKGADMGNSFAQAALAGAYDQGRGLAKDEAQAILWYQKAADQGVAHAQNNLAWLYVEATDLSLRDPVKALVYSKKAVASDKGADDPGFLDTLAAAYFANKQCDTAVQTQQKALSLAKGDTGDYQKRLDRYEDAVKRGQCRSE